MSDMMTKAAQFLGVIVATAAVSFFTAQGTAETQAKSTAEEATENTVSTGTFESTAEFNCERIGDLKDAVQRELDDLRGDIRVTIAITLGPQAEGPSELSRLLTALLDRFENTTLVVDDQPCSKAIEP